MSLVDEANTLRVISGELMTYVNLAIDCIESAKKKKFHLSDDEWDDLDWANTVMPDPIINKKLRTHFQFPICYGK